MIKVGVCCFEDVSDPENGWASISGEESIRVSGCSELRHDVLWVTNLPFKQYKAMNLLTTPHIYDTQFFRTSLDQIAKELGLENNEEKLSQVSSMIFSKIANKGNTYFNADLSTPGYRYHKSLSYRLIPEFARKRPSGKNSGDIFEAIQNSTQANQAMSGVQKPHGSNVVNFVFPRMPYAKWLLSQKYPSGSKWTEIKQKDDSAIIGFEDGRQIRGTKAVLERLMGLGEKNAVFLRVNVQSMDPFYQRFASFGTSGQFGPSYNQKHRRWACLPEVLELSRYAKVEIMGGYLTPYYDGDLVDDSFLIGSGMSYAKGLLAENVWAALCSPISTQSGSTETLIGPYMRAYDRIACGRAASHFAKAGFVVGSYSMGRLIVFVRPGEETQSARAAFEAGLLPPISFMNAGDDNG